MQHRLGDAGQGALARRQRHAQLVAQIADLQLLDHVPDRSAGVGDTAQLGEELQGLVHLETVGQGQVPGSETDAAHRLRPLARQLELAEVHGALVGADRPQRHQQRGGLAGAVGPDDRHPLAGLHPQRHAVDGP